jgi:hypothetical protein
MHTPPSGFYVRRIDDVALDCDGLMNPLPSYRPATSLRPAVPWGRVGSSVRTASYYQVLARSCGRKSSMVAAYLLPIVRKPRRGQILHRKPLLDIFYCEITLVRLVKELPNVSFRDPAHGQGLRLTVASNRIDEFVEL